jgi:hypothetical protein
MRELLYSGEWADGEKDGVGYYFPRKVVDGITLGTSRVISVRAIGVLLATTPEDLLIGDVAQIGYWER